MTDLSSFRPYRVELLLQAGVDVNSGDGAESDNKVLHWAASFANLSTLKLILGKLCTLSQQFTLVNHLASQNYLLTIFVGNLFLLTA